MTSDLDRRKFFSQTGALLGGMLVSPKLGVMGAVGAVVAGAALGAKSEKNGEESLSDLKQGTQRLLRSGEPLNASGHGFGGRISSLCAVRIPSSPKERRYAVVVGHEEIASGWSGGLSVMEIKLENGRWVHVIQSVLNRRWSSNSAVALDGALLGAEGAAHRVQKMSGGMRSVVASCELPGSKVLCCEGGDESDPDAGWIVEVSPLTGHVVRRFSLGRVFAENIAIQARAGQPVEVFMSARDGRKFKFSSHQRFEPALAQASHTFLGMGELYVRTDEGWSSVSSGLTHGEWEDRLRSLVTARSSRELSASSLSLPVYELPDNLGRLLVESTSDGGSQLLAVTGV